MTFLEIDITVKLQKIISKHPQIKPEHLRSVVLETCDVERFLDYEIIDGGVKPFASTLVANLQDPQFKTSQGKQPLVALLYYLIETHEGRFTDADIAFLESVRALYPKQHASSTRQQSMREAFAKERAQPEKSAPQEPVKRNWHDEIITKYDLEVTMGEFKAPLVDGKALGFVMSGNRDILSHYILKRAEHEFKMLLQGEHILKEIHLHQADLAPTGFSLPTLIAEKIKKAYAYAHEKDLVLKHTKQHVLLIVWNHDLPGEMLREALLSFWSTWQPAIAPYLQRRMLCFVLILAQVSPANEPCMIDSFTTLQLPTNFDVQGHMLSWLEGKLRRLPVSASDRKHCRAMLNDPNATMWQTLHALGNIADYLQGACNPERYHEHDSYHMRGRLR